MRAHLRYLAATILVAAIVAPYAGYLVRGTMPFIHDARGMASTGLILGMAAVLVAGQSAFGAGRSLAVAESLILGVVCLGLAAMWMETNGTVLAAFVAGIIFVWAFEVLRHMETPTGPIHA